VLIEISHGNYRENSLAGRFFDISVIFLMMMTGFQHQKGSLGAYRNLSRELSRKLARRCFEFLDDDRIPASEMRA